MSLLNELLEFVQRVPEVCRTDFRSHVELTDDATSDGIAWQDLNRARRSRGDHRRRRTTENVCGCPWAHVARYGVLAADAPPEEPGQDDIAERHRGEGPREFEAVRKGGDRAEQPAAPHKRLEREPRVEEHDQRLVREIRDHAEDQRAATDGAALPT